MSDGPDRLALEVVGLPPDEFCLFVYGGNTSQLPFGDGFLCVGPLSPRVFQILPALRASPDGTVLQRIDYDALPPNGPITAGSTYAFQLLYRDTGFGVSGFNGSDGVQVTFQP